MISLLLIRTLSVIVVIVSALVNTAMPRQGRLANRSLTLAVRETAGPPPANAQPGPAGRPARGPMVPGSFSILMVGK
jgi:hypothetical protein